MNHREFTDKDYWQYVEWLLSRGREAPAQDELSHKGYVVFDKDQDIAIGFMIDSNKSCVLGHFASNPEIENKDRGEAVDYLLDLLVEKAKASGYRYVMMSTNLPRLMQRLEERDFMIFEENMTHLGRVL